MALAQQQIAPCMDRDKVPIMARRRRPNRLWHCPNCIARGCSVAARRQPRLLRNSIILAAAAGGRGLIDLDHGIVADAKSGVSGAGKRQPRRPTSCPRRIICRVCSIYSSPTGELLEQIGVDQSQIVFTPHLLPIPVEFSHHLRPLPRAQTQAAVAKVYHDFFAASPWCASTTKCCRRFILVHTICRHRFSHCTDGGARSSSVA